MRSVGAMSSSPNKRKNQLSIAPNPLPKVFETVKKGKVDTHPNKVMCMIGEYFGADGEPFVMPVVKKVEGQMAEDIREGKHGNPIIV